MKTRDKIIALIIFTLTVSGLVTYLVILPTMRDIKEIKNLIYNERVDLEKKYLRGQLLKKTIEDFEKIKPQEDKILSASLIRGQELNFITTLEEIANKNNVEQKLQIGFDQIDETKSFQKIPLTLELEGLFIPIMKYLQDLERLNYYVTISSVQINTIGQGQNSDDIRIKTTLNGALYITTPEEKNNIL